MATTVTLPLAVRPYSKLPAAKTYDPGSEDTERGNIERGIPLTVGLLEIMLTDDATLTIAPTLNGEGLHAGQSGFAEVTQDGTGGHALTITNATGTDGVFPQPSQGALDVTMYQWVWNGAMFVVSLFAERYSAGGSDAAFTLALSRIESALLPLPRVEVLVDGYAVVFA